MYIYLFSGWFACNDSTQLNDHFEWYERPSNQRLLAKGHRGQIHRCLGLTWSPGAGEREAVEAGGAGKSLQDVSQQTTNPGRQVQPLILARQRSKVKGRDWPPGMSSLHDFFISKFLAVSCLNQTHCLLMHDILIWHLSKSWISYINLCLSGIK